jgi:hypothetical protein
MSCNNNCRQGRDCTCSMHRIPGLHSADGGHSVNFGVSFPIEDTPPVTPEKAGSWAIYAAGVIAFVLFTLFAFRLGMPNVLG